MNINLSDDVSHPLYLQVYEYYKNMILDGKLVPNSKLPSIRSCSEQLQVSRTTIETAYLCLAADGYIIAKPQSGYFVTERNITKKEVSSSISIDNSSEQIKYDFTSSNVDKESFDFNLWKRYVKNVLRQDDRMLSYGEPQGEYELRHALALYVSKKRNAICTPDQIVIGAGSQSLLHLLCPLLDTRKNIKFHDSKFMQGIAIFEDHHFKICSSEETADILYMTPSHMTKLGDVMPTSSRLKLLKKAISENKLIIEDDYDNEFRYLNKQTPCLQGLSSGENVVYISTFSKLLLPSIRLSFMILPNDILSLYYKRKKFYNQTASKAEQLALCQFLRDGHLDSQLRKLKRLYSNKAKLLQSELQTCFLDLADVSLGESVFLVHIKLNMNISSKEAIEKAKKFGILLFQASDDNSSPANLVLSCSEVNQESFSDACHLLKKALLS